MPEKVNATAEDIFRSLQNRFAEASSNYVAGVRPAAKAARQLLNDTLNVGNEVRRFIGVDFDATCPKRHKPILFLASKFGTWASELTLVAGTLLKAGYGVKIATEDGSPPHLLGPSLNPDFVDGAWRCSVVSPEERDLALKFLNPSSGEHTLLRRDNIFDLSRLAKPPQVGDYLKDPTLLDKYKIALVDLVKIATQYDAIIIAGGSGAVPGFMDDRGLQSLILAFHQLQKPIMAQCNGGLAVAQTVDPETRKSILFGRAVTTHSWLDEYQSGWGWTLGFSRDTNTFWTNGQFDLKAYLDAENWDAPGTVGNPLVDSEGLFQNAAGLGGVFFSPPGSAYSVVVDENLITCRTTPDGYPGVLALIAVMDGRPSLRGRFFIDADERGRRQVSRPSSVTPKHWEAGSPLEAARAGDITTLTRWLAEGGDPDFTDQDGWTPLMIAAARGNAAIVDLLLSHDIPRARHADPARRFPGADGLAIYMAGQSGDIATVEALLRAMPEDVFDVATVNGHTVLLQAAFYGQKKHHELAEFLLRNIGRILSIPDNDHEATEAARKRLMTATNVRGQNPLALAEAYDIQSMVALFEKFDSTTEDQRNQYYCQLLARIAPPAPRNEAEAQIQELTEQLISVIQVGLDKARSDSSTMSSLSTDDQNVLTEIKRRIAEPGLEINRLGGPLQRTPLIVACTGADTNDRLKTLRSAIVEILLDQGADPLIHEVHAMGVNAVVRSAVWGHTYLLERFGSVLSPTVFAGALNEKPLVNGFTALHDSVLRALSAYGPQLEQYLMQIKWLVAHGANDNIEDHSGRTQKKIALEALEDPTFRDNASKVLNALASATATHA